MSNIALGLPQYSCLYQWNLLILSRCRLFILMTKQQYSTSDSDINSVHATICVYASDSDINSVHATICVCIW